MRLSPAAPRDRLVIGERQRPVADDLAGFVALAGDQQHVARLQARDRRRGSPRARSPISTRAGRGGQDRGADRGRIFAARIVVGDDDAVGHLGGDRAHQRPLAGVAVAAAAEHHDELAAT